MANMNIRTPRFYVDQINYILSRGIAQDGRFDIRTDTDMIAIQNGSEAELFDMKPLNLVDFDTSTLANRTKHVVVKADLYSTPVKSFVAILNHNLNTCKGKFRIARTGTGTNLHTVDFPSATAVQPTVVVNGTVSGSTPYEVTPSYDGSTIVTFSESSDKFWGIQFEGSNSGSFDTTTDFSVGCILIGEYYDMPHAPDLSVKRSIVFDSVRLNESVGGQRYSNMTSFGRSVSSTSKSPFSTPTNNVNVYGGRLAYDLNFSYLNSSDIMPDEYREQGVYDSVLDDIWNKTNGRHLPFIFSIDKDSTGTDAESEHIFARFAQDSLDMTQVAPDVFDVSMTIEEEF